MFDGFASLTKMALDAFKVIFIDPSTGHVLYENGTRFRGTSTELRSERSFASLERAKSYCRGTVRRHPYVQCIVHDESGSELWRFHDQEWFAQRSADSQGRVRAQRFKDKRTFLGFLVVYTGVIVGLAIVLIWSGLSAWAVLCLAALVAFLTWLAIVVWF
jgi:hypothetical protein